MALKTKEAGTMKTEQAQSGKTRTGKSHLRAVAWMVATLGAFAATTDALADADTALDLTGSSLCRYGKVVSWALGDTPSNIDTLTFKPEIGGARSPYQVRVKDDGIYLVGNGTMVIVR